MQNSFVCSVRPTWEHNCFAPMLGWFTSGLHRPSVRICVNPQLCPSQSVTHTHAHTYTCVHTHTHVCAHTHRHVCAHRSARTHAIGRAARMSCSTKRATSWTLHSGQIVPQGSHAGKVMAAVDRGYAVPIRPTHDVWQHNPKLHRHLTDSGCLESDVSRAFGGVQHWSEFLQRSWEKGISNRAIWIFQLSVPGRSQPRTWQLESAFAQPRCQDADLPCNSAMPCPKLAVSYLSHLHQHFHIPLAAGETARSCFLTIVLNSLRQGARLCWSHQHTKYYTYRTASSDNFRVIN